MKISELVKKLNEIKKEHGDIEVSAAQKMFHESYEGEKFSHESIEVKVEKLKMFNPDTCKVSRKKETFAVIIPEHMDLDL